ncbi:MULTISPECIES: HAD family phosphatase [unclassified Salinibacterium]|uniref:HAD family hydrolase n=1 Tax=unclassified Salinibacterium TaxID=2632331 RepID=UPI0018CDB5DA|nr:MULTISPECIES: HAD family hydrolase [unclassified Salinibacterium]MBH0055047.1 HAD family hydrolase [Salinibacterium sp. SWN139]MBH0083811.1 HAD family hydrolase [Salinibacterium sp. SWN167]
MHEVTSPPPSQNAVVAFFDVDNTLMRGASAFYLSKEAWRRGIVGWRDIARFAWHQFRFVAVGENHKHMTSARERALEIVGGHSLQTLIDLAETIYERDILPNLWPETVDLAKEHLAKGHEVWLITATPQFVAQVIAERLGLTGALGTRVRAEDGFLTGELDGHVLHGPEKAAVATELAGRLGANLADCWAYSDSSNDIPLLSAVGNRVAVNADVKLTHYAQKMGWPVLPLSRAGLKEARRRVKQQAKIVRKNAR